MLEEIFNMVVSKLFRQSSNGLLAFGLTLFLASAAFGQADWSQFLGPTRNGISAETGILKDWSGDKLKLNWSLPVGQGYAIGSVANGKYFNFDAIDSETGTLARVRQIDLETGKTGWTFTAPTTYQDLYGYDSGPRTSPLIFDGRVYAYGSEGMLWCLDAKSGDKIWEIDTIEKFGVIQNFFGVSSCPVIYNDLLLVMIGGSPDESKAVPPGKLNLVKPNGSAVIALNQKTGEEVWRFGDDLASYTSMKIVKMHGRDVGLAWMRDHLLAFAPEDGTKLFKFKWRARKLESVNASTPLAYEDKIYLGESYEKGGLVLKVSEAWEPEIVWTDDGKRNKSLAPHWNTPVLHNGFLFGCSGQQSGSSELRCVEFLTGKVRWSEKGLGRSSATFCDGHLIVMAERGELFLAKATPEKFTKVTLYGGDQKFLYPCWSAPIVSDGKLIVKGKKKVACFQLIAAE